MLRVFLADPPHAGRADAWVRYAADGRPIARGRDVPARRPADAAVEVVLAAHQTRLIALALPPMSRDRLQAAVGFALEDRLATTPGESAIAIAAAGDNSVRVAVAANSLVRAIASLEPRARRIVPEAALAPLASGWTWCASGAGGGFVRRADGSAFTVGDSPAASGDALSGELVAALAQAAREGAVPATVHVAFECDATRLSQWSRTSGIPFVTAPAWHWEQASPAAFAAAPDFLDVARLRAIDPARARWSSTWRPALVLATLALVIHVGALLSQWTWQSVGNWRVSRALVADASVANVPGDATAPMAATAIARQNAQLRHRALQSAADDALPLLSRAAPTLGALPAGTLRSARYADGAWTIELGKVDSAAISRVLRALAAGGVDALAAPTSAGTRLRLALAATAR